MRKWFVPWAFAIAAMLAGCDAKQTVDSFAPKPEVDIGRGYIEDIRARNFAPVRKAMDPQYLTGIDKALERIAGLFPSRPLKNIKLVGTNTIKETAFTTYQFSYEYEFSESWLLAQIVMRRTGGNLKIEGVTITPLADSLERFNAFTFRNKGFAHYFFFLAAMALPIFTFATAVVCWRTPIPRLKWLWIVFVLLGFCTFTLNWTTGAIDFQILRVALLGAGFGQAPFGPLLLQISLPVGAIIFWFRRRSWCPPPAKTADNF